MKPRNIELHIEELVLHGFELKDRYALGDAIQHELTRILSEQGIPLPIELSYRITHVDGGVYDLKRGVTVSAIGTQVAQKVYRGLQQ